MPSRKIQIIFTLFFVATLTSSCYVSKPLAVEVRVSVNTSFPVITKNEGNSHFIEKHSEEEYLAAYLKELTKEFAVNHLIIDNTSPEFIVQISSLEITESTKLDTIKDAKSKDNGTIQELTQATLKTQGTVVRIADQSTHKWEADDDDKETVTNNQSLQQIIDGQNKDNSIYRKKAFTDDELVVQSGVCGRRAAVRIAHAIGNILKK